MQARKDILVGHLGMTVLALQQGFRVQVRDRDELGIELGLELRICVWVRVKCGCLNTKSVMPKGYTSSKIMKICRYSMCEVFPRYDNGK